MNPVTAHILLRDRHHWLGTGAGYAQDRDGALTLMPVPGPAGGKAVDMAGSYPPAREVSGLALGPCERVFVADTAHDRVLLVEPRCESRAWIPGLRSPRGLALSDEALLVADGGNQRVQSLALPALEANWLPFQGGTPLSIAVDSLRRLVLIDAAAKTVHRISPMGAPDPAFDQAIAASGRLTAPLFVATGGNDTVLVADSAHERVDLFDASGAYLRSLAGPAGWMPGAIAADATRIYVANAADGSILLFDHAGALHGKVGGWRGPVSALALAGNDDLYIKPGLDAAYFHFIAGAAYVGSAQLLAGPFDAGVERAWERLWIDTGLPTGTHITIEAAQAALPAPAPTAADWRPLEGSDALLAPLAPAVRPRRFVWMRITLSTTIAQATPLLRQARAATAAEDLREYLPSTYRRNDPGDFLKHALQLLRGEFAAVEEHIDDIPRLSDPRFAVASNLPWLAQWLALELPLIAGGDERRDLIARAAALFARRGTAASIAGFAELHTGVRPAIIESFTQRRLWVLGESSMLGFDTQLPPLDPTGMVMPDPLLATGCCPISKGEPVIGRAVVGDAGPLAAFQIGEPLFAEDAHRFCVVVDSYRVAHQSTLEELCRIIDREKPAHTDYRVEIVAPELRIGLQAMVGVDTIVGGPPPAWHLDQHLLGGTAWLMPPDGAARVGEAAIDGTLRLN